MDSLFYISVFNFLILYLSFKLLIKRKLWTIYSYPTAEGKKVKSKKVYSGLGLVCVIATITSFIFYIQFNNYEMKNFNYFLVILIFSTFIGFLDDILDLDPYLKLTIIFFICLFISFSFYEGANVGIDKFYFLVTIFIILVYFNSVNFIDGSDGFLICHIIFYILGALLIVSNVNFKILDDYLIFLIIFLSTSLAFLFFNLSGKIIIGNTGSFATGFILCYFGILLVRNDLTYQFLILIMYPLIDVILSLLNKLIIKKDLIKKDFCYFFLKPIKNRGQTHLYVLKSFLVYNIFNFFSLYLSIYINSFFGLFCSIISSSILILHYQKN